MAILKRKTLELKFQENPIDYVKVIGVRSGQETRVMAAYNMPRDSLLIYYKSGQRELMEVSMELMDIFLMYIEA